MLGTWGGKIAGTPVLLVNPGVAVPTGPVFAGWDQHDRGEIMPETALADLRNDMTAAAMRIAPVIAEVLAALADAGGAVLVRMSGSGATCFALYADTDARARAAVQIARRGWWQKETVLL